MYEDQEPYDVYCGEGCGHHDVINQCCWIVPKRGLCSDVKEGQLCLYGFKEVAGMIMNPQELRSLRGTQNEE